MKFLRLFWLHWFLACVVAERLKEFNFPPRFFPGKWMARVHFPADHLGRCEFVYVGKKGNSEWRGRVPLQPMKELSCVVKSTGLMSTLLIGNSNIKYFEDAAFKDGIRIFGGLVTGESKNETMIVPASIFGNESICEIEGDKPEATTQKAYGDDESVVDEAYLMRTSESGHKEWLVKLQEAIEGINMSRICFNPILTADVLSPARDPSVHLGFEDDSPGKNNGTNTEQLLLRNTTESSEARLVATRRFLALPSYTFFKKIQQELIIDEFVDTQSLEKSSGIILSAGTTKAKQQLETMISLNLAAQCRIFVQPLDFAFDLSERDSLDNISVERKPTHYYSMEIDAAKRFVLLPTMETALPLSLEGSVTLSFTNNGFGVINQQGQSVRLPESRTFPFSSILLLWNNTEHICVTDVNVHFTKNSVRRLFALWSNGTVDEPGKKLPKPLYEHREGYQNAQLGKCVVKPFCTGMCSLLDVTPPPKPTTKKRPTTTTSTTAKPEAFKGNLKSQGVPYRSKWFFLLGFLIGILIGLVLGINMAVLFRRAFYEEYLEYTELERQELAATETDDTATVKDADGKPIAKPSCDDLQTSDTVNWQTVECDDKQTMTSLFNLLKKKEQVNEDDMDSVNTETTEAKQATAPRKKTAKKAQKKQNKKEDTEMGRSLKGSEKSEVDHNGTLQTTTHHTHDETQKGTTVAGQNKKKNDETLHGLTVDEDCNDLEETVKADEKGSKKKVKTPKTPKSNKKNKKSERQREKEKKQQSKEETERDETKGNDDYVVMQSTN